jgi:hypothetical protein
MSAVWRRSVWIRHVRERSRIKIRGQNVKTDLDSILMTMATMTRSTSSTCTASVLLFLTTASLMTVGARALSLFNNSNRHAQKMEAVVRRYFEGVNKKDPDQIRSCFGDSASIRDVCGVSYSNTARTVEASALVDRCMEFVTAHPDVKVDFLYGPEKGRTSDWVVAHWYETGTWSGESCGIPAPATNRPMTVQGQTRFLVDRDILKITDIVVTRTFTEWEERMLEKRQEEAKTQ